MKQPARHSFRTGDGVERAWLESGAGPTLSMLPGSRLEIFEAKRGGHHFACLENPGGFNDLASDFIVVE